MKFKRVEHVAIAVKNMDKMRDIFENKLGQLDWIDVRPLKDGQKSFNEILKGEASSPKIILKP